MLVMEVVCIADPGDPIDLTLKELTERKGIKGGGGGGVSDKARIGHPGRRGGGGLRKGGRSGVALEILLLLLKTREAGEARGGGELKEPLTITKGEGH